ncbi:glycosyltransferase family 2 protein [Phycicoccus duodecadis]|uniref:GT2 family glycosyltransferase n=1 Tax=Phycicoccus duodecadis TaxID=173053 RepID=A0A2N3YIB2_9MICO|nr:galactosyltransferase-related protein [Phycicoccus duodecadis]PKW26558.1 GT2 family glycosyltransferase [Phycicoccus duodecadis]
MTGLPDGTPRVAVVTIAHGRHDHLRGQRWGLARQTRVPDLHVVVAMDDPGLTAVLADTPVAALEDHVVPVPVAGGRLPLARARNVGVAAALERGAEVVVLLDVDCIPGPDLVARYTEVLAPRLGRHVGFPVVACGEVRYLDAPTTAVAEDARSWAALDAGSAPHRARPALPAGAVQRSHDTRLFWSLCFAVTAQDWARIGGFDEGYVGYGAEDTDFGQRLEAAYGALLWLGGATAYHQDHGDGGLPVRHVRDIVENGARFAARWGWWPMRGWLDAFEDLGLVTVDAERGYVLTSERRDAP